MRAAWSPGAPARLGRGVDPEALDLDRAAGGAQHAGGLERLVVHAGLGGDGEHAGDLADERADLLGGQRAVAADLVGERGGLDELGDDVGDRSGVTVLLRDVEHAEQGGVVDDGGAAGGVHGVGGGLGGHQPDPDGAVERGVHGAPEVAGRGRAQALLEAVAPRDLGPVPDTVHGAIVGARGVGVGEAVRWRPGQDG